MVKKAQNMNESDYRALKDRVSYSLLKLYVDDREAFYRQVVLGEAKEEKDSTATIVGSLVHTLLSGQDFDEKYCLFGATEPKGQMLELADALYKRSVRSMYEGVQQDSFQLIFNDAVQNVKYDISGKEVAFKGKDVAKILDMFDGSDAEMYYKEKLKAHGKIIVYPSHIDKAEKCVQKIKESNFTSEYANIKSGGDIEVFNEMVHLYNFWGVPFKSMIDKVVIDHSNKTICSYDWKTTWQIENPQGAYLKNGYYLQAALYYAALLDYRNNTESLSDYVIAPMKFIFCDTSGFADPIVFKLNYEDLNAAANGFNIGTRHYEGLHEIAEDIAWHLETGIWTTTRKVFENNGVITTDIDYNGCY